MKMLQKSENKTENTGEIKQGLAELRVNGKIYDEWTSIQVTRSIRQIAGTFTLEVSERWPINGEKTRTLGGGSFPPVKMGQSCQVFLDGECLITGYIDTIKPQYQDNRHSISIEGRDKTCDLVDCAAIHKTGQWKKAKIDEIARDLLAPFKIGLVVDTDVGEVFNSFNIEENETVAHCLSRAARMRSLLLTSDPLGRLCITRVSQSRFSIPLEEGKNIKSANADLTWKERFSEYHLKGYVKMGAGSDKKYTALKVMVPDTEINRYRPRVLIPEGSGSESSFRSRLEWERNTRNGQSSNAHITVQGWGGVCQESGDKKYVLWMPNKNVTVDSASLYLLNKNMLITDCTWSMSMGEGTTTQLSVVDPKAFETLVSHKK